MRSDASYPRGRTARVLAAALVLAGVFPRGGAAAGRAIEAVRVSRTAGLATAEVEFPCEVRYLSHTPHGTGMRFQIRVSLGETCRAEMGSGLRSELYEPPGRDIAGIREITLNTGAASEAVLAVSFRRPTAVGVSQGSSRNVIRLTAGTGREAPGPVVQGSPPAPAPASPAAEGADGRRGGSPGREPLRLMESVPFVPADRFVVRLSADHAGTAGPELPAAAGSTLYVKDVTAGARRWRELRVGFFDSEQQAQRVLDAMVGRFPDAVVGVAGVEEQALAHAGALLPGEPAPLRGAEAPSVPEPLTDTPEALTEEEAVELAMEARDALLARDYERSIRIYSRLLQEPAYSARGEARELLGVARERNGQLAHARAEYQAFLAEFPEGTDAQRVRQRLAGLVSALEPPPARVSRPEREAATAAEDGWDLSGGLSQYYRRDVVRQREDEKDVLGQSGLQSRVDFLARHHGERLDLLGRVNAGYYYDMRPEERGPEDQGLISNAYMELSDRELDLRAILGRQSLYRSGVLGRFDGAHVSFKWRPDITLNATAGLPVDSARHLADTNRRFYAMSADLDDLVGAWDFSFFGHLQRIDGIADREAVGGEARWRDGSWNLYGALDMDLSYEVVNSALLIANWRATDRITFNGRVNVRAAPFLTTRNALIGQSVSTIGELGEIYTEPELRRLARNRTAQSRSASIGLSMPVFQRFHFNGDLTYQETDATVASGGVDSVPATGPQYVYSASVTGSSLFRGGDTAVFGFRHVESLEALITALSFDLRLPLGSRLRLNPRMSFSLRDGQGDGSRRWIASPMLRAIYRWGKRHRLEGEVGGEWSSRNSPSLDPLLPDAGEDGFASFLNVGYWMEF